MEINGSGGSLVEKEYDLPLEVLWKLGLEVLEDMHVEVTSRDDGEHLLNGTLVSEEKSFLFGRPKIKEVAFAVQPLTEGCQVIIDIHKKRLEVYSFRVQNKETERFMQLFDAKIAAYRAHQICPSCGKTIQADAAFCPYCGAAIKK
jgi:rubrerythrin